MKRIAAIALLAVTAALLLCSCGRRDPFSRWRGADGGVELLTGNVLPRDSLGEDGQLYADLRYVDFYEKKSGSWKKIGRDSDLGVALVTWEDAGGTERSPLILRVGDRVPEPDASGMGSRFLGWYAGRSGGKWDFSAPVPDSMTLVAGYADRMEGTPALLTSHDFWNRQIPDEGKTRVLVIYLTFTDGIGADEEELDRMFNGEADSAHRMESVAAYYRYNSNGRKELEFTVFVYDTGMTSREAYEVTHAEDDGYRNILKEAYEDIRTKGLLDLTAFDGNRDGLADAVVFLTGEDPYRTTDTGEDRYLFPGSRVLDLLSEPDVSRPALAVYTKTSRALVEPAPDPQEPYIGPGVLIHEIGHMFGLHDYYGGMDDDGHFVGPLGGLDMQDGNIGDWNPFSKFTCGWVDPIVITPDVESVTLKIGCTSETGDVILIPTSKGWNGTPFDEYVLVDVMAPAGANGYYWQYQTGLSARDVRSTEGAKGGVRILHVDARQLLSYGAGSETWVKEADTYDDLVRAAALARSDVAYQVLNRFYNGAVTDPVIPGDSPYFHLLELIPRDGSSRFRKYDPEITRTSFAPEDLFRPGDTFSMETCPGSFTLWPTMNDGGTLDYSVTVELYDPVAMEAVVTITRIAP